MDSYLTFAVGVGEEGVEATTGETSLDVCSGQSAETGCAGCHHCPAPRYRTISHLISLSVFIQLLLGTHLFTALVMMFFIFKIFKMT